MSRARIRIAIAEDQALVLGALAYFTRHWS